MARVTVVNDNEDFLELVREILDDERYDTTTIDGDRPEALEQIRASRPDVLMIDLRLGSDGLHGWEIAQQVRADDQLKGVPILICSGDIMALKELAPELAEGRDLAVLTKPFAVDELCDTVERLLAQPVGS